MTYLAAFTQLEGLLRVPAHRLTEAEYARTSLLSFAHWLCIDRLVVKREQQTWSPVQMTPSR